MIKLLASILFILAMFPKLVFAHDTGKPTIHITSKGFEPSELTINLGESVIFENTDSVKHWPASDIHPSHGIYPEFDPKRGLEPGEQWEFTFDKAGMWSMHDHLVPEFIGEIIVNNEQNVSPTPAPKNENNFILKLKIFIYKLFPFYSDKKFKSIDMYELTKNRNDLSFWLNVKGPKKLMEVLLDQSNGGASRDCHQEAHILGRDAFEIFGKKAFADGDLSCHSGFYHGAMEGFLKQNGTTDLANKIKEICKGFETSFGTFECLHGVGHGLMAFKNYNLPEAIKACDLLTNKFDQTSCYGGVFMENIIIGQDQGVDKDHKTTWLNSDPHFPCNSPALDQGNYDVQFQCYMMQTSRMLFLLTDYDKISEECLKSPSNLISVCFQSLGRDIAGTTLRNPDQIKNNCDKINQNYYQNCILGALNVIVDFWGDKIAGYPHELCNKLNETTKNYCFINLSSRLRDVYGTNTNAIKQSCNLMGSYQTQCQEIALN